jgi:hypothetical protein
MRLSGSHIFWTSGLQPGVSKASYGLYKMGGLKVPFIKDVIQGKSINHHDKLGNHSNPILQPLLEQQQRKRLKELWPAELIDG